MPLSAAPDVSAPEKFSGLPPELALQPAARLLTRLIEDPGFWEAELLPSLEAARGAQECYVVRCHDAPGGSYSRQVFVWSPGTGTRVHDHSFWGVYRCAPGSVLEERYERLDDGSRSGHPRMKKVWKLPWSPDDGASMRASWATRRRAWRHARHDDGRGGRLGAPGIRNPRRRLRAADRAPLPQPVVRRIAGGRLYRKVAQRLL